MRRRYLYSIAVVVFGLTGLIVHYQEVGVSLASELGMIVGGLAGYFIGRRRTK